MSRETRARGAPPPVRRARLAVATLFFANGCGLGSWVPHIPDVKSALGLSDGVLGLALLAIAAGAVLALPTAGLLTARHGSRGITQAAAVFFCAVLPLPLLAPDLPLLLAALVLLGIGTGALDVAMNAHAVAIEERFERPIMSGLHGLFSIGGLAGAALAGAAMYAGMSPLGHLATAAAVLGAAVLVALPFLLLTAPSAGGPVFVLPRGPVVVLGLLALGGLLVEGAVGDWSAVYLRDALGTDPGTAALGFAAFSLTMALGRMTGDRLVERLGTGPILCLGAGVAATALSGALLLGQPLAAIVGFAGLGLGLANVIPVLFSAAGRMPGLPAGIGIAAVSTAGYCGFLAGPPLIGFVAELGGLPVGLGVVAATLGLMALGAICLQRRHTGAPVAEAA